MSAKGAAGRRRTKKEPRSSLGTDLGAVPVLRAFVLTPRAEQDVSDIWNYIADDNIESADRVVAAIKNAIIKLTQNPGIGHWREELADKRHRFFLAYSYLIVYRPETSPMQVIRVLHAGRDVQSILALSAEHNP
jgi:antitoxin ParD1/3/4/toxin ParE1/3/4